MNEIDEIVVAVGSNNPVKLGATLMGFQAMCPDMNFRIVPVEFPSIVSPNPTSDIEAIAGATYRAYSALIKCSDATYGVGLESGANEIKFMGWFESSWVVIRDRNVKIGMGSSVRMQIPQKAIQLLQDGRVKTLGEAVDLLFETKECAKNQGLFGLMTKNRITRTSACRDAVIAALSPWANPGLF